MSDARFPSLVFFVVAAIQALADAWGALGLGHRCPPSAGGPARGCRSPRPLAESTTSFRLIITPNAQIDLAFRVSGYVVDVRQDERRRDGRTRCSWSRAPAVTTGLVLARIRAIDYQTVVDRAQGHTRRIGCQLSMRQRLHSPRRTRHLTQAESDFGRIATLWQQESVTKPADRREQSATGRCASQGGCGFCRSGSPLGQRAVRSGSANCGKPGLLFWATPSCVLPSMPIVLERRVDVGSSLSRRARAAFTIADLHLVKARFSGF